VKFGIFVFGDNHPELGRSNQRYYEEVLTMAEWAEELGFDSFWLGEHHFYWYGTCVSPPMLIAAIGQRTKKIRLGPAVSVLPFHHPLVVAEEYALADNLCAGRLNFAIGSGFSPVSNTAVPDVHGGSEGYWDGFDVILKAWTQESFPTENFPDRKRLLHMKPAKPMPPTWVAASSDETLIKAGKLGFPTMGIPFVRSNSILEVKQKNDLFMESYSRAGHKEEPDIMVALHVYLHSSGEEAVRFSRPYFERILEYLRTSRRPGSKVPDFDNVGKKTRFFPRPARGEIFATKSVTLSSGWSSARRVGGGRTMEIMSMRFFPFK
jgi:alkanesulfonate monooxygenase SsuD/methylene tetrahydromethanopterin reductase-like flavin-dependent oxidoreductase (luciferase family)